MPTKTKAPEERVTSGVESLSSKEKSHLAKQIDRLGEAKSEMKALEEEVNDLSAAIKTALKVGDELGGQNYVAKLSQFMSAPLDPEKTFKILGKKKFLDCVNVVAKRVDDYLGKAEKDKCLGKPKPTQRLTVTELK